MERTAPKPVEYDVAKVVQSVSSFAGVLKDSKDPAIRLAAHQLLVNVKQARIKA